MISCFRFFSSCFIEFRPLSSCWNCCRLGCVISCFKFFSCCLIEFRPGSLQLLIYGMLGVNFQWDAVKFEFGEQTIHLISMLFAFCKQRKELLACLLDDDGFVSCVGVMINRRIYDPRRWHKRSSSNGIHVSGQPPTGWVLIWAAGRFKHWRHCWFMAHPPGLLLHYKNSDQIGRPGCINLIVLSKCCTLKELTFTRISTLKIQRNFFGNSLCIFANLACFASIVTTMREKYVAISVRKIFSHIFHSFSLLSLFLFVCDKYCRFVSLTWCFCFHNTFFQSLMNSDQQTFVV